MSTLPLVDDALFIDNSSLERFTTCPRSAFYYISKRREGAEDREALGFGKRIHEILDARYRFHPNVIPDEASTGITVPGTTTRMVQRADAVFSDWTPEEGSFRTYATALNFIAEYNAMYPVEAFSVAVLPDGRPGVEIPFALPLCTLEADRVIKVVWTGRVDLLYKREDRYYIMDHKTTSVLGPTYFKDFELSSQVFGYVWAMQKLLGCVIDGFCVNALAFRKPTKTGKSLELLRHIVPIDQALVEEWEHDTQTIVSDLVNMSQRSDWPKHTKWCVGKYGVCEYAPICALPPANREVLLHSGAYRDVTWSPLT